MQTDFDSIGRRVAFPFYIFMSLLMAAMMFAGMRALQGGKLFLVIALFAAHIGLYWGNYLKRGEVRGWWFFYYPAQTALMISITLALGGGGTFGLSFIGTASICIVAESLGIWGNSRRSLALGLFYFSMMFAVLYLLMDRADFAAGLSGLLVNGGFIVLLMVMFNQQIIERQKAMELAESLESANAKLAAYNARIESLTLQAERQRMARELHDTLAQGVAGLVLQLEAVKAHLSAGRAERAASIVEQSINRARSTLSESRAAIDDLRAMNVSLTDAVRGQVENFIQSAGLPCDLQLAVAENQFPAEIANHILNILGEALTNITRHAQATRAQVVFAARNKTLQLEVRDNGKGFDPAQTAGGHYGLLGMQERARLAGGTLEIESSEQGTCVRFKTGGAA